MKRIKYIFILIIICISLQTYGQKFGNCSVSLDTIWANPNTDILMPVYFSGWDQPDVGAISMDVSLVDTLMVGYRGCQDFNPAFPSLGAGNVYYNTNLQRCFIAWDNTNTSNLGSGILLNIKLRFKGGCTPITFSTVPGQCEIADGNAIPYTGVWYNGLVCEITGISANSEEISFHVGPNPATSELKIDYVADENTSVEIMLINLLGEITFNEVRNADAGYNALNIDISSMPEGLYCVVLKSGTFFFTKKININH